MIRSRRLVLVALALPVVAGLLWLGVWQIQRRTWKLALIAQVEQRLAAPPVAAPGPEAWPTIATGDAYRRLSVSGTYRPGGTTFVQAVTDLGPGFWRIDPLASDRGFTILINRGFVPADQRARVTPTPAGHVTVTGLLRLPEPHGGFLRSNRPAEDRWYSRDVGAIAARHRLGTVAPYFIDADAATSPGWPRGGLTVIAFPNNHLQYALTWFAMAALFAGAIAWLALRDSEG